MKTIDPKFINLAQLIELTNISRSTIYRLLHTDPSFPRPFKLRGGNRLYWDIDQVKAYLASQVKAYA
ncbi:TPA: AlpA family phage regulatory protein [Escherichia coli]|uniref:helix-turn-helix transcriptional regulator n=1 Tax=Escherichia coli TaxID=562 RepID=UPI000BE1B058|nr:AlpA family phage regulatory protein [Escherichia coli]EER7646070.1 AlpA family phage regulatory protein [Escherichia coli]EES1893317.1 AlpA family phage regulatory protein [Escherichia coli]EES8590838.1 AlpA family phage regulatory protein [Escherichia coli]EFE2458540.1 AlpA family phage regulatory protein [Escherichia coli]EFF2612279.1 AlpA family phage regulatory protein [Escherichia coli]